LRNTNEYELAVIVYLSHLDQGIGARRWNKLISAIKSQNVKVLTITSDFKLEKSIFDRDTLIFKTSYPTLLDQNPINFLSKLVYRALMIYRMLQVSGYPYDKAVKDRNAIHKALDYSTSLGVNKFIVSGAPFDLCHIVIKHLIDTDAQIIVDFRDPWTWSEHYKKLSSKRFSCEAQKEEEVIQRANRILVPALSMKSYLESKYPDYAFKMEVLEHGFDKEKIEVIGASRQENPRKIIYAGTVYAGTEECYHKIANLVESQQGEYVFELYANNQLTSDIDAYTYTKVFEPISEDDYLVLLKSANIFLSVVPNRFKDFISSKYYEIIACGTFILIVSESGDLIDFIEKYGFGKGIHPSQLSDVLMHIDNISSDMTNTHIELTNYSFHTLGSRIYQMFKD